MTTKELSQLYWLKQEIAIDEERLEKLESRARKVSPSGCGGGSSFAASKIEIYVADIIDLQAIISAKKQQCYYEQKRLERYISSIPDSQIRLLFTLRFVECKSWVQIAKRVKGVSPDSARMTVNRYIKCNI